MNNTDLNTTQIYLDDVGKYPMLSKDEERELGEKMLRGDLDAREKLINANLRLVIWCAKGFLNQGVEYMDLIQAGNAGLITAVDKWEPTRGKLSTVAVYWIKQAMQREISNNSRVVRIPEGRRLQLRQYREYVWAWRKLTHGEIPTTEQIMDHFGWTRQTVEELKRLDQASYVPIDQPVEDESETIGDKIAAPVDVTVKEAANERKKKAVQVAMQYLTPQDQDLISALYGVGKPKKSLKELQELLGISDTEISNRAREILMTLRRPEILKQIRRQL